ncbi:MAG TPA: hypothetical protein VLU99_04770 [Nitrososphaerales archaeon]|nr:hypothetical protein [Nitrososphaerales archaeon]HUK75085.1 hypothetical protein [Nitrososphaerales archaeon]
MLEDILKNALEGLTVIEESSGSVSRVLARQLGAFARARGRKVAFVSLLTWEQAVVREAPKIRVDAVTESQGHGPQGGFPRSQVAPFLDGGSYDLLVVDAISSFLFDRDERESVETIRHLAKMVKQGKTFIVTFDPGLIDDKTAAYLRAAADTVIVVKADLLGEKVSRTLYVPKLKDSKPLDKLIKITVDEAGVEVDTREFVG